ncbi:hypothetical protein GCM10007092_19280 [Thermus composti]|uniref:Ig-like domain-containing protein n=1 Tax=Thermus composti TaxID=532059 RepID=A0ABV6Q0K4_9DEIN|nr:hypothetical protein GCM10007092_19280 [Thermus composti]
MRRYLVLGGAALAGALLLLGGCGRVASPNAGTANLSVTISQPQNGAFTNARDVEVKVSATGAKVDSVRVEYQGPSGNGSISLSPQGGVWKGSLPSSLASGVYTLTAKASAGSVEKESPSIQFTLDLDKPTLEVIEPSDKPIVLQSNKDLTIQVQARDDLSGVKQVRLFVGSTPVDVAPSVSEDVYTFYVNPLFGYSLRHYSRRHPSYPGDG